MSKSLSELIEASNPNQHLPSSQFVDVASYNRMKGIAVVLAKCIEIAKSQYTPGMTLSLLNDGLSSAKDILESK